MSKRNLKVLSLGGANLILDRYFVESLGCYNTHDTLVTLVNGIIDELEFNEDAMKKIALNAMTALFRENPDLAIEVYRKADKKANAC